MQYALMTEPQVGGSYDDLLGLARWAEESGLAAFARSDHYLDMETSSDATDAFASLGGLARDTASIALTVLVSPITFRHPAVIAKTAATIDAMSGGRLELGVGTGWMQSEHDAFGLELPEMRERFSRLWEALAYLSAAFGRAAPGFHGRHYHLDEIAVHPAPTGRLPLIVGGGGPQKTPTLAGRFADEYNSFVAPLETLPPRLAVMRDAAEDAGRDPTEILVSLMVPVFVGVDEADYRDVLGEAAAARSVTSSDLEERFRDRGIPHGPVERFAEWAAAAGAAGIGRIYLQEYRRLDAIDTGRLGQLLAVARRD
jgi:alkanesulfonate monooxygenase SsuD/methylene tetrahydromethanopterin reductase-like flavin-dependent oxidoreductase (luciferase family)